MPSKTLIIYPLTVTPFRFDDCYPALHGEFLESRVHCIYLFNTLRPRQNGRRFPDDIFKCIFFNENYEFRLKFHCSLFLGAQLTMVQIIAWHRPRDKPLSEPMIISLPTHICVTRPQWVNAIWDNSLALRRHKRVILLSDKENPQPISSAW